MYTVNHRMDGLIVCKEQQNHSKNQHNDCHHFLVHGIAVVLGTDGVVLSHSSGDVAEVAQSQVEGRGEDVEHEDPSDGAHKVPNIAHLQGKGKGRVIFIETVCNFSKGFGAVVISALLSKSESLVRTPKKKNNKTVR